VADLAADAVAGDVDDCVHARAESIDGANRREFAVLGRRQLGVARVGTGA